MADVKWIKITTDIFSDEKIMLIEQMPEADTMLVIWFKLLCMAGRDNNNGIFIMNNRIPYTEEMLATLFRRPLTTVRLAISTFEAFGMIDIIDEVITVVNWEKHQNIEGLEKIKEQNRLRQARFKERKKQKLLESNVIGNVEVTHGNATDIEEDLEKEPEEKIRYKDITDMYNTICVSFPSVKTISDARKKAIKARLNTYSIDDFKTLFEKAESSDFLKGKNTSNWTATFDWLIKDANMAKVLDGNYDNKDKKKVINTGNNRFNNFEQRSYDYSALESGIMAAQQQKEPVEPDPEFLARKEALESRLKEKYGKK
ncbi:MAG: phage replisome organizer N-terminal domain-containing protein [Lachnospiraceae bacterium]|nr:phage replisome organizer N-terminal domain-containing protein [Lachnospiraceae bacterium]